MFTLECITYGMVVHPKKWAEPRCSNIEKDSDDSGLDLCTALPEYDTFLALFHLVLLYLREVNCSFF